MYPIDRLTRTHSGEAADFAKASEVTRAALLRNGDTVIAPERGALPPLWAALGDDSYEESPVQQIVSPQIGSYSFTDATGKERLGTLANAHKRALIERSLSEVTFNQIIAVDEVQKGGTISELASILQHLLPRFDVLAAQDSRKANITQARTQKYIKIATNKIRGVSSTVVPMPLIATDRAALLNKVTYDRPERVPTELTPTLKTVRNVEAERIFRVIGTAARIPELVCDGYLQDELLKLKTINPDKTEKWVGWLSASLR